MLTLDDFAPLVGDVFVVVDDGAEGHAANRRHTAALIDARAIGRPTDGGRQPFSLLFEGPLEPMLPQRVYTVQHRALAPLGIFLVPVSRVAAGVQYEAIFN